MRDRVVHVLDRIGEVVGRAAVRADDDEVLELLVRDLDPAQDGVLPGRRPLVGHPEADRPLVLVGLAPVDELLRQLPAALHRVELEGDRAVPVDPEPAPASAGSARSPRRPRGSCRCSRSAAGTLRSRPRANSQLKRKVRTPPMCRKPVGLGAMRTRTLMGRPLAHERGGAEGNGRVCRACGSCPAPAPGKAGTCAPRRLPSSLRLIAVAYRRAPRRPLLGRDQEGARPRGRARRRFAPALRAEPADVALSRPRPRATWPRSASAAGARDRRASSSTRSTSSTSRARTTSSTRRASRRCARRWTPRPRSRRTASSSTSARTRAPGSRRASSASCRRWRRCSSAASETTWLLMENSAGAGRHDRPLGRRARGASRGPRPPPAPRDLPRLLPPLGLRLRRHGPRASSTGCSPTSTPAVGLDRLRALHVNDAQAPLGSNRDRHANILEGLIGERLGVFLGHPALQGLPAVLEVPGPDGHGPDEDEMRKLRELHARSVPA